MLNINSELQKIKEYLSSKINLPVEIVPNYDDGNKVIVKCTYNDNGKNKKAEYSFYIKYYEDRDNYASASYLLDCDFWYGDGGSGYAVEYNSLHDFIKTSMLEEIINKYGKVGSLKEIESLDNIKELTLFDDLDDEEENDPVDDDDLDIYNEEINVSSGNIQMSMFDEIDNTSNNVDLKDLLSYGIDDYYMKNLYGETFGVIFDELNKLPKYAEYYEKLRSYLKNKLPNGTYENTKFDSKPTFITDTKNIITIIGNRRQTPIYVYKMYENNFA